MVHSWPRRHAFARRRQQTNILNLFDGAAILRLIAHHQVVAFLAFQHLRDGLAAHRGFDRVLNIGHVDAEAIGLGAVHHQVQVGLADHAEQTQSFDAADLAHHADDFVALLFQQRQIGSINLDGEFALHAADSFLHVVGNRLRKIPGDSGKLFGFLAQRFNQLVFVLMEQRPPLLLGLQIDKIFRVEEARGVGAIVGPPHLAHHLRHFRELREHHARLVHNASPFGGTRTRRERPARPNRAFIQMRQEFRADVARQQPTRPPDSPGPCPP